MNWRAGVEADLDEVLQTDVIFNNVTRVCCRFPTSRFLNWLHATTPAEEIQLIKPSLKLNSKLALLLAQGIRAKAKDLKRAFKTTDKV